jgi:hypothetical protein
MSTRNAALQIACNPTHYGNTFFQRQPILFCPHDAELLMYNVAMRLDPKFEANSYWAPSLRRSNHIFDEHKDEPISRLRPPLCHLHQKNYING